MGSDLYHGETLKGTKNNTMIHVQKYYGTFLVEVHFSLYHSS